MMMSTTVRCIASSLVALALLASTGQAESPKKRLLLLGQGPDGHPPATHEYMAGMKLLDQWLHQTRELDVRIVTADEPWTDGPNLIKEADGVVLFLSEGAKWAHVDPRRLEALAELARRGGGIVGLHWGIGTKDAKNIDGYLKLLGGCHGGPDRRFKVVQTSVHVADPRHPITTGMGDFDVRDEFYYRLKFVQPVGSVHPLLQAEIEGRPETVAWSWERPDGGRSFGFSGLHFHDNWRLVEYRRLVAQGVLWTMKLPVTKQGLPVEVTADDLKLPPPTGP